MSETRAVICILMLILCRVSAQNGTNTEVYVAVAAGITTALFIIAVVAIITWMCLWYFPTPSDDRDEHSDITDHLLTRLKATPISDIPDPVGELAASTVQVALAGLSSTSAHDQLQTDDDSHLSQVKIEPTDQVKLSDAPTASVVHDAQVQTDDDFSDSSSEIESSVHTGATSPTTKAQPTQVLQRKPCSPARVIHVAPQSHVPSDSQMKPASGAAADSGSHQIVHKHNPTLQRSQAQVASSFFSTSTSQSHHRSSFRLKLRKSSSDDKLLLLEEND